MVCQNTRFCRQRYGLCWWLHSAREGGYFLGSVIPLASLPCPLSAFLLIWLLLPTRMKRRGTFPWGAMLASTVSPISWSASLSHKASASTSSVWVSTVLCEQTWAELAVRRGWDQDFLRVLLCHGPRQLL